MNEFIKEFAEAIEIEDASVLTAETNFRELEEWSSLSVMLLIAMFDEVYEKEIGDKDIRTCATIQELYNLATA